MKILYFDLSMGAAGDMLTGALLELLPGREEFVRELNSIGVPGVRVSYEKTKKCSIEGSRMRVMIDGAEEGEETHFNGDLILSHSSHDNDSSHEDSGHSSHDHEDCSPEGHSLDNHHHHHTGMDMISSIVNGLNVSLKVKNDIKNIYSIIQKAEASVHGTSVEMVHFHEVGMMDAVMDIASVCLLIERLKPDRILSTAVNTGSGHVHTMHGILPVPAPATAEILRGIPSYGSSIKGELCTPTGAAIIKYFVSEFGPMPLMKIENTGYGMGKKDFDTANCVRAIIGTSWDKGSPGEGRTLNATETSGYAKACRDGEMSKGSEVSGDGEMPKGSEVSGYGEISKSSEVSGIMDGILEEEITELSVNLDDMTGEEIGFCEEMLFKEGALDVYTVPIQMKKSRPGVKLSVLLKSSDREKIIDLLFRYTGSLGIRENIFHRYILKRKIETEETLYGPVRKKKAFYKGSEREKYEYDDLKRIAIRQNISIREVKKRLKGS